MGLFLNVCRIEVSKTRTINTLHDQTRPSYIPLPYDFRTDESQSKGPIQGPWGRGRGKNSGVLNEVIDGGTRKRSPGTTYSSTDGDTCRMSSVEVTLKTTTVTSPSPPSHPSRSQSRTDHISCDLISLTVLLSFRKSISCQVKSQK